MVLAGGAMGMLILLRACGGGAPPEINRASAASVAVPLVSTYSPSPTAPTEIAGVTSGVATCVTLMSCDSEPVGSAQPSLTPEPTPSIPTAQELAKAAAIARGEIPATGTASPTPTPTATAKAEKVLTAKQQAALEAKKQKARIAKAMKTDCAADALEVSLRTDSRIYAKGEKPKLFIAVKNVGDLPCRMDLGSGALSFTIMSGNDRIWSSDDCQGKGAKDLRVLKPGQALEARSIWNGSRSAPGCPKGMADAKPGTYVVQGRAGSVTPERRAVFTVK
jgi:hypothetical protein